MRTKTKLPDSLIVASVEALKKELWEKCKHTPLMSTTEGRMLLKLNSCLYTGYPNRVEDYSI